MPKTLGPLCSRNHDHEGTGKSLRYKNGACIECQRERESKKTKAQAQINLAQKDQELKVQNGCYYVVVVHNTSIPKQVEEKAKSMAGKFVSSIEKQSGKNAVGIFSFAAPIAAANFSRKISHRVTAVSNPVLNPNKVNIFDIF